MLLNENYQKWIWIELIGFDNELPDYGVQAYLDRCKFMPDGFSLLLTWAEFALDYKGQEYEYELAPNEQSYGGHMYSPERKRQNWTNFQLRNLIAELHRRNIKVYLSYFNFAGSFLAKHKYLSETTAENAQIGTINVLKTMKTDTENETPFEDILHEATIRVLCDYGFDGVQIADGISSYRLSLQYGDYSKNMLDQFVDYSNIKLPEGKDPAAYIWAEHRQKWIEFHVNRWDSFFDKYIKKIKAAGKEAIFNSAWTRDPFEAIYRYGVDYRRIAAKGIEGCMVEDVSAGLAILSDHDNGHLMSDKMRRRIHYEFLASLMMVRAAVPSLRITPLAGIHDTNEQWGVLEHMPTSMGRNVLCNLNTLFYDGISKKYRPITDGPFFCLGDSLYESDWDFIKKYWNIGMPNENAHPCGVTLMWSNERLDNEILRFVEFRQTPTYRIAADLLYAGAQIYSIAQMEHLHEITGPILITNPKLLPPEELEAVKNYENGEVFYIGENIETKAVLTEENSFGNMSFGYSSCQAETKYIKNPEKYDFDPKHSLEKCNMSWTHPLDYKPVSEEFYKKCAEHINKICNLPRIIEHGDSCQIIATKTDEKHYRIILANDEYYYVHPMVDMGAEIEEVKCLTRYEGYPVYKNGSTFQCRVAGRGADVFEVKLRG